MKASSVQFDGETQGGFAGIIAIEIKLLVRAEDFDRADAFLTKHLHKA